MIEVISNVMIKAFLVVLLSNGTALHLEHPSGRTAASIAECNAQSAEMYDKVFGTQERFAKASADIRLFLAASIGAEAANEVIILQIGGTCVDVGFPA
jgi:hypothetical protein